MKRLLIGTLLIGSIALYSCDVTQAKGGCPSKKDMKMRLSKLIDRDFQIASAKPMEGMKEFCEVVIKVGLRPIVIYTNREGKNIIVGNAFNLETKENLTQKVMDKHMTVSKDILNRLEEHVNMKEGKGDKYIYYISDPDCPFCKRLSPMLKEWAKQKKVQIRVILYPLPIHPQAKPKSIAMICDGKGYDSIHKDVSTKNQCEKGKKAIDRNLQFLQELGVSGTPTVIGMNGKYIVGLPRSPEDLDSLIQ